jgi:hypothetical protein
MLPGGFKTLHQQHLLLQPQENICTGRFHNVDSAILLNYLAN